MGAGCCAERLSWIGSLCSARGLPLCPLLWKLLSGIASSEHYYEPHPHFAACSGWGEMPVPRVVIWPALFCLPQLPLPLSHFPLFLTCGFTIGHLLL